MVADNHLDYHLVLHLDDVRHLQAIFKGLDHQLVQIIHSCLINQSGKLSLNGLSLAYIQIFRQLNVLVSNTKPLHTRSDLLAYTNLDLADTVHQRRERQIHLDLDREITLRHRHLSLVVIGHLHKLLSTIWVALFRIEALVEVRKEAFPFTKPPVNQHVDVVLVTVPHYLLELLLQLN